MEEERALYEVTLAWALSLADSFTLWLSTTNGRDRPEDVARLGSLGAVTTIPGSGKKFFESSRATAEADSPPYRRTPSGSLCPKFSRGRTKCPSSTMVGEAETTIALLPARATTDGVG